MFSLPQKDKELPPWTSIFIEVALRALLRLHHDYLLYSTSQDPKIQPDFRALNSGPGVAYADEITVCSTIAQEFLATRYVSGVWLDGSPSGLIRPGQRYFKIEREPKYPNCNHRADFRVERVENEKTIGPPTYIEAKRAFRWSTKLISQSLPENLCLEVMDDIRKLRKVAEIELKVGRRVRGYVLVWNVQEIGGPTDIGATQYFNNISSATGVLWQIRMYPLEAVNFTPDSSDANVPNIDTWLWVALAEVTELAAEDLKP